MIKIEFNSPLNYGETVYYLQNNKINKGEIMSICLLDDNDGTTIKYAVKTKSHCLLDFTTEVYTSQEELFKAIMLREDTDEKETIGK